MTTIDFSQGFGSSISSCVLFGILCPNLEPLAQVFGSTPSPLVQIPAVARKFYQAHGDQIDQVVMFANFANAMGNAFAFELNINPDVAGIGLDPDNLASFYGSDGRLVSFLNMNRLARYPADPNSVIPGLAGDNNTLDLMGQEAGHNWLAFVNFDDAGVCSNLLLGRQSAHWSFFHDSDASDMEGNKWQDNGDGTFTSIEATERFSALDQYIMGLRSSGEVPNFFFIRNPDPVGCFAWDFGERSCAPQVGVTVTGGTRQDVTLSQIQTCEGLRSPVSGFSASNPTTTWRQAFVLLVRGGTSVPQTDIDKIETIRSAWVPYFNAATSGRGSIDTTLPTLLDNAAFVQQQYLDFLDREPDSPGGSFWTNQLESGLPRANLIEFFMDSEEFRFKGKFIAQTYFGILARVADYDGFRGWLGGLLNGVSREQIVQAFLNSAEFQANFGSTLTNGQFVERMYLNVLQRFPDLDGFNFWLGQLDGGFMTRAQVALNFLDSEEFQHSQPIQDWVNVSLLYFDMLRRNPDLNELLGWVEALDGGIPLLSVIDGFLNSEEYKARFFLMG